MTLCVPVRREGDRDAGQDYGKQPAEQQEALGSIQR